MLRAPMKSAHYITKQNSNHSTAYSTGLSITVMLSGAIDAQAVISVACNERLNCQNRVRLQKLMNTDFKEFSVFFPRVQCLHRWSQDSAADKLVNTGFILKLLSGVIHIHTTPSMHQVILHVSHD